MAMLLWAGRIRFAAPALVLLVATTSLFWFNRDAGLDNWAIYFFGSYGLGAAAWWASDRKQLAFWLGVIATVAIAALVFDFRLRIALALAVALVLGFGHRTGLLEKWPNVAAALPSSARFPTRFSWCTSRSTCWPTPCIVQLELVVAGRCHFGHFRRVDRKHRRRHAVLPLDRKSGG
jgi:hypothetical protein